MRVSTLGLGARSATIAALKSDAELPHLKYQAVGVNGSVPCGCVLREIL